jgi:hypothetical protein
LLVAIVAIFVIAYAAIALEHPIKINKSASALIGAGLLWTVYAVLSGDHALIDRQLNDSVSSTAQIILSDWRDDDRRGDRRSQRL